LLLCAGGTVCSAAGLIYDNGLPDPGAGPSAREMSKYVQADDFYLAAPTRIESAKLWDYEDITKFYGYLLWEIRANNSDNTPGQLLHSGTSTNLVHTRTGNSFVAYDEYVTTFNLGPVTLPAGRYWFTLHNGPLSNVGGACPGLECAVVAWAATNRPGTYPSQGRSLIPPFDLESWFSHEWPGYLSEFAFQLNGTPGPSIKSVAKNSGSPQISFTSVNGQNYRIEYKNNLSDPWSTVLGADTVPGTGEVVQVSDPDPNVRTLPRRFYRVLLL
jgi:hypothetical protein